MPLRKLPQIKVWADLPPDLSKHKLYKGKFVLTDDGKFFAKLFPEKEFDGSKFFHNIVLEEMGVQDTESAAVKRQVAGGGKIEVEMMDDYAEVRLHGKSSIYGPYDPEQVDIAEVEGVIRTMFELIDLPILVIPDLDS